MNKVFILYAQECHFPCWRWGVAVSQDREL
jgi:hypothetical protein